MTDTTSIHGADAAQTIRNITGYLLLLPYLDQGPLYNQINFSLPVGRASISGSNPATDQSAIFTSPLEAFRCPSDSVYQDPRTYSGSSEHYWMRNNYRTSYAFAERTYANNNRRSYQEDGSAAKGAFGINGGAKLAFVKDGTSNTMFMCESPFHKTSTVYGPYWSQWTYTNSIVPAYGINVNHVSSTGVEYDYVYAFRAGSAHEGGMHILMGDGAVRFLGENIDMGIVRSLVSINGREVVGEF